MRSRILIRSASGRDYEFDLPSKRGETACLIPNPDGSWELEFLPDREVRDTEDLIAEEWASLPSQSHDSDRARAACKRLLDRRNPALLLIPQKTGGHAARVAGKYRGWIALLTGKEPNPGTPTAWYRRQVALASGPVYRFTVVPEANRRELLWSDGDEEVSWKPSEGFESRLRDAVAPSIAQLLEASSLSYEIEVDAPVTDGSPWEILPLGRNRSYHFGRGEQAVEEGAVRVALDSDLGRVSRALIELHHRDKGWSMVRRGTGDITLNGRLLQPSAGLEEPGSEAGRGGIELLHGDRFGIGPYLFEYQTNAIRRVDHLAQGEVLSQSLVFPVKDIDSGKTRCILDDVSTCIRSGEFIGILGGSGQGKSTLLNALSGLKPAPKGQSWIAGIPSAALCRKAPGFIGFVPQDDIFHRELTVDQAFHYSARLRLKLPKSTLKPLIDQILETLSLEEHRSKPIYKLSGGQRKRCSIGIELLSKPAVLFLDEPSSGLDPATEADLMEMLQSLTASKLTVVCTTHVLQKAYIFNRIFFVHGGKVIFEGTTEEAEVFFDESQQGDEEGASRVPLERIYSTVLEGRKSAADWRERFEQDHRVAKVEGSPPEKGAKVKPPAVKTTGFGRQYATLMARQWRILCSDFRNVAFLFAQAVLIGAIVAFVADKEGFRMFLGLIAAMWFGCSNGAQQIIGELAVFKREHLCGLGMHAYIASKFTFQTAISVAQSLLLFAVIVVTSHFAHPNELPENFGQLLVEREHPGKIYPRSESGENERPEEKSAPEDTAANAAANAAALITPEEDEFLEAVRASDMARIKSARENLKNSGYRDDEIEELRKRVAGGGSVAAGVMAPTEIPGQGWYEWLAGWLHLQHNLVPNTGVEASSPAEEISKAKEWVRKLPLAFVAANCLVLKIGAFCLSALAGVAMGLAVSSLVKSTTQAVMWVPLLLIPQILLGGYVITLCDMSPLVRRVATFAPSHCVQRMVDVSHLFGRTVPSLSNRTETPTFMTYGEGKGEPVKWIQRNPRTGVEEEFEQDFYEEADANTSWQNLRVVFPRVGQHKIALDVGGNEKEVVESRRDVIGQKFEYFVEIRAAYPSLAILGGWVMGSYLLIWTSLASQRGK